MAAKEQAMFENMHRVEPHQSRSPRAPGLKINVSDMQVREMPLSALGSPTESGHIYSPGPLSAPSPILGPVSNIFGETIKEVSSTFRRHNLNDLAHTVPSLMDVKIEPLELEPPSTRSALAELTKQELIEKVMQYERQMEGSIPLRRMSIVNQEPCDQEPTRESQGKKKRGRGVMMN